MKLPARNPVPFGYQSLAAFWLILEMLSGCAISNPAPGGTPGASRDSISRAEVLQIAQAYLKHEWRGTRANIFHGLDTNGVAIDTPDVKWWTRDGGWQFDGHINVGVSYSWGGDSSIEEFDAGVRAGRPAGNKVREPLSHPPASTLPVGVDCSGFVSRCWKLPIRRSTEDLIKDCVELQSFDELLPGDAVNKANHHVVLFQQWLDRKKHTTMRVFQADGARVQESDYSRSWLTEHGFTPLRYRGILDSAAEK